MRETRDSDLAVCELLLAAFFLGALARILCGDGFLALIPELPGPAPVWIAAILACDASMAGSLPARYVLPLSTLALGAVSASVGAAILALGPDWWRQLLLLLLSVPLHFLAAGWSLTTAGRMRRLLAGHGGGGRPCAVSLLVFVAAASAAGLVFTLFRHELL